MHAIAPLKKKKTIGRSRRRVYDEEEMTGREFKYHKHTNTHDILVYVHLFV
jgi:hypothetical protein